MGAVMQDMWIDVGDARDIPPLRATKVRFGEETVAVFRTRPTNILP